VTVKDCFGNPLPEHAFVIRHTELPQFLNCPREWFLSSHNGMNLEPRLTNPKLRFGTCWHKALEEYYKNGFSLDEAIRGWQEAMSEERDRIYQEIGEGLYDPDMVETLNQEDELGTNLLRHYVPWDQEENRKIGLRVQHVERRLVVPIGDSIYLAAKLDGEVTDSAGDYWVLEHKSQGKSSRVDNPDNLVLDVQMGLQLITLQIALNEETNIRGALYNLTRKQLPGPRVKAPVFGRHRVTRNKHELRNLYNYLKRNAHQMISISENAGHFNTEEDASNLLNMIDYNPQMFGKCAWGCAFREVCESANRGENVNYLLESNFKRRERDIWQVLEEETNE